MLDDSWKEAKKEAQANCLAGISQDPYNGNTKQNLYPNDDDDNHDDGNKTKKNHYYNFLNTTIIETQSQQQQQQLLPSDAKQQF